MRFGTASPAASAGTADDDESDGSESTDRPPRTSAKYSILTSRPSTSSTKSSARSPSTCSPRSGPRPWVTTASRLTTRTSTVSWKKLVGASCGVRDPGCAQADPPVHVHRTVSSSGRAVWIVLRVKFMVLRAYCGDLGPQSTDYRRKRRTRSRFGSIPRGTTGQTTRRARLSAGLSSSGDTSRIEASLLRHGTATRRLLSCPLSAAGPTPAPAFFHPCPLMPPSRLHRSPESRDRP